MHVTSLINVILKLEFVRNASNIAFEILQNESKQQPNLEEHGDEAYILKLYMKELKKQGIAWKPHNQNLHIQGFYKVNNNQLVTFDKNQIM